MIKPRNATFWSKVKDVRVPSAPRSVGGLSASAPLERGAQPVGIGAEIRSVRLQRELLESKPITLMSDVGSLGALEGMPCARERLEISLDNHKFLEGLFASRCEYLLVLPKLRRDFVRRALHLVHASLNVASRMARPRDPTEIEPEFDHAVPIDRR